MITYAENIGIYKSWADGSFGSTFLLSIWLHIWLTNNYLAELKLLTFIYKFRFR